jgi:hypothetical protein
MADALKAQSNPIQFSLCNGTTPTFGRGCYRGSIMENEWPLERDMELYHLHHRVERELFEPCHILCPQRHEWCVLRISGCLAQADFDCDRQWGVDLARVTHSLRYVGGVQTANRPRHGCKDPVFVPFAYPDHNICFSSSACSLVPNSRSLR